MVVLILFLMYAGEDKFLGEKRTSTAISGLLLETSVTVITTIPTSGWCCHTSECFGSSCSSVLCQS